MCTGPFDQRTEEPEILPRSTDRASEASRALRVPIRITWCMWGRRSYRAPARSRRSTRSWAGQFIGVGSRIRQRMGQPSRRRSVPVGRCPRAGFWDRRCGTDGSLSAQGAGVDALFVASGIHRDEVIENGEINAARLQELFVR